MRSLWNWTWVCVLLACGLPASSRFHAREPAHGPPALAGGDGYHASPVAPQAVAEQGTPRALCGGGERAPGGPSAGGKPGELVFSVKSWEGEYASKDVPGGVESTPATGAIWSVKGDGTGLKKVVALGKDTE